MALGLTKYNQHLSRLHNSVEGNKIRNNQENEAKKEYFANYSIHYVSLGERMKRDVERSIKYLESIITTFLSLEIYRLQV